MKSVQRNDTTSLRGSDFQTNLILQVILLSKVDITIKVTHIFIKIKLLEKCEISKNY